jgi:ribose 5-phosphate isomerase B
MIFLGADHRGFALKEKIKDWLSKWGEEFADLGNQKLDPNDDFPDYASLVARKVSAGEGVGILLCGSGGMALVANKFKRVRAVETWNVATAEHAKAHDDANVLMLAADFVTDEQAKKMVKIWLRTPVKKEEKYQRRLAKIKQIESRQLR